MAERDPNTEARETLELALKDPGSAGIFYVTAEAQAEIESALSVVLAALSEFDGAGAEKEGVKMSHDSTATLVIRQRFNAPALAVPEGKTELLLRRYPDGEEGDTVIESRAWVHSNGVVYDWPEPDRQTPPEDAPDA